jgi:transposase-like protein
MARTSVSKEAIIAEYLTGDYTYRQLGAKYGVDFRTIHYWVSKYKGKGTRGKKCRDVVEALPPPSTEVKQLQADLRKATLHREVLEEILKLSEQLTGIELRKKFGTKQF